MRRATSKNALYLGYRVQAPFVRWGRPRTRGYETKTTHSERERKREGIGLEKEKGTVPSSVTFQPLRSTTRGRVWESEKEKKKKKKRKVRNNIEAIQDRMKKKDECIREWERSPYIERSQIVSKGEKERMREARESTSAGVRELVPRADTQKRTKREEGRASISTVGWCCFSDNGE